MALIWIPIEDAELNPAGPPPLPSQVDATTLVDAVITLRITEAAFDTVRKRLDQPTSRWYWVSCQVAPDGYHLTIRRK